MKLEQLLNQRADGVQTMIKACKQISLVALALFFICAPSANAVTIVTHYIGGSAPENVAGGGNLPDIMNAAARMWESAYSDPITITLHYGWATTGDAGTHTLIEQGEQPNHEIAGLILFDNSNAAPFFLDPTPNLNEEYRRRTDEFQDLGGGEINVARILANPIGDAVGRIDLLSVALHEIGHAMGLCAANTSFIEQSYDGVISIDGELPFKGTVVPLAFNNSGVVPHFDASAIAYGGVMGGINGNERRTLSELDIVANAQVSRFTIQSLYPQHTIQSGETESADQTSGSGRGSLSSHASNRSAAGRRSLSGE
jgi:hypothetical protein